MNESRWRYKKIARGHYLAVAICSLCGAEYTNGNVGASKFCPVCAAKVKREKTAERVKKHRERRKMEVAYNPSSLTDQDRRRSLLCEKFVFEILA